MEYKIAIIGLHNVILGFKGLGMDTFSVDKPKQALDTLKDLITKKEHAIVFITEDIAQDIKEELEELSRVTLPAIIAVPSHKGSFGVGLGRLRKTVEQAVGSDILFRK